MSGDRIFSAMAKEFICFDPKNENESNIPRVLRSENLKRVVVISNGKIKGEKKTYKKAAYPQKQKGESFSILHREVAH